MLRVLILATALVLSFFWTNVTGLCPAGWERYQESCFNFVQRETGWYQAQADCIRKGGGLAMIETVEENAFLRQYLNNHSNLFYGYDMWLGARVDEGRWRWVDGALMDPEAYDDWQQGKPALNTSLVCLEFESEFNNHWNDDYCDELNFHICERPFNPMTPPPLTSQPPDSTPTTDSDTTTSMAATSPVASSSSDSSADTTSAASLVTTITPTTPEPSPASSTSTAAPSSLEVVTSGPTLPPDTSAHTDVSTAADHVTHTSHVHRSSRSSLSDLVG